MGPYATEDDARNWRDIVARRNAQWDAEDDD
jgi:hypothetical protein